ncbi:4219_t:CDS:2 [Entrophospora sp. SA101]|nr:7333_t:CDS:2 [Entrophospora sp. SA101]CAJ0836077.1 4219_t:CDS:2 [Entrophospora sp. SA101]
MSSLTPLLNSEKYYDCDINTNVNTEFNYIDNIDNLDNINGTDYNDNGLNDNDGSEKYITFVPHSGFHNQRIGLENAIFIAWFLNRTLIVPPALLLTKFRVPFGKMIRLSKRLKAESVDSVCGNIKINKEKKKCEEFHSSYTLYPYDQLFDFTFIRQNLKTINTPNFDIDTVIEMLNITEPRKEIYLDFTTKDRNQMYDTGEKPYTMSDNKTLESLQLLKKRPEKLIYFGSLFGSGRIRKNLKSSRTFSERFQKSFVPSNPVMLNVVASIVEKMGGAGNYISSHARGGDGSFATKSEEHFTDLVRQIDKKYPEISPYLISLKNKCPPIEKNETTKRKNLYVASDINREYESMKVFLDKFPCLKMLSDFEDQLEPYKSLINPVDNKVMSHFLIPLTDLMIAANGFDVFTIGGSTYGGYLGGYHAFLKKKWFSDLVTKVRESYPISEITPKELHDMISKAPKPIILDVREKDERSNGIIPTAIPLSRGVLERDVERKVISMDEVNVDNGRNIIVYCAGGLRSILAAESLIRLGYKKENVKSLTGGYGEWKKSGFEVDVDGSQKS